MDQVRRYELVGGAFLTVGGVVLDAVGDTLFAGQERLAGTTAIALIIVGFILMLLAFISGRRASVPVAARKEEAAPRPRSITYDIEDSPNVTIGSTTSTADDFLRGKDLKNLSVGNSVHNPRWMGDTRKTSASE